MKAAKEFGINKTMKIAGLLVFINDVHSLGLANTEGLQLADSWYWNQDDASRKFAKRFFDKYKRMPSSLQAADYSATMTYLKAVKAGARPTVTRSWPTLKKTKMERLLQQGQIRADGRMIHDMYLFQVKGPRNPPHRGTTTRPWPRCPANRPSPPWPSPSARCSRSNCKTRRRAGIRPAAAAACKPD
jgi:branched-chain amino acid transport system substrate-binding protein